MTVDVEKIKELIETQSWKALHQAVVNLEPFEVAELIDELPDQDDVFLFRVLPRELANNTFHHLSKDKQENVLEVLAKNIGRLSKFLNDMDPDDRTAFLEEMPGQVTQRLLLLLSPEERSIATKLLGYPEDSIGRLMTPEYVAVKPHFTIAQTLEHIRLYGRDSETLNVVYIVDENWKLIDDIRMREIILARPEQTISELLDKRFVSLSAFADQETAINIFHDHDRIALPVTDTDGVLLGIVTFDDVMDVAAEETTEDFHKFGALQDAIFNPLQASVIHIFKKRILWLFALVFMNVFSGAAISLFENTIHTMVTLVFFMPLLIGSGGNAGAQSATLMIRALATGDVEMKDWLRLVGKEFMIALLLGLTMAAGAALIASVRSPQIIVVVALSMLCIVVVGSIIGLLLPFVFTRLRIDPATASAPLITSIADISGIAIYFTIATWYLSL